MKNKISNHIENHLKVIKNNFNEINNCIYEITNIIKKTYKNKNTFFLAGNGGSASDCEHIAGELVGRFKKKRKPYKAISLTTDTSVITCIANDFGYEKIFERQLEANGRKGDLLLVMSTSGKSKNIINALKIAKRKKINTIALLGNNGGYCNNIADYSYIVPSNNTAVIQEVHHLIGHSFCNLLD